ncbi:MAG: 50S ribosomal protein L10 [Nanoarchaeota archaeon]|nr:50S ribosomal protein L10 [Nanoarchaeota archaeon]
MKQNLRESIPEKKLNEVKELSELLKNQKTILIASIKNLPASQFQEISKKLRGKAIIKVPKKNLIFRAIENLKDSNLEKIKKCIKESSVILFSNVDSFELAGDLIENKSPAKAKANQEAPEDIEIQEGPTDLISGPVISEFGALGIPIQINNGKIVIKSSKIIVKKGEKISENAASIMGKLDMKPFSIGFIPLSAFDTKEKKLYLEININKEEAVKEIKESFNKSLSFAVEIGYFSNDTIGFMIGKASIHEKALEKLVKEKSEEPEVKKEKSEEKTKEETVGEEKKKENNQTSEQKSEGEN